MRVAVLGATGAVGREMIADLEESKIQDLQIGLFASKRSAGERISFRGKSQEVKSFDLKLLEGFNYCLMSAGGAVSRQYSEAIRNMGITVIDNSSAWRMVPGVPLIVPEVNGTQLQNLPKDSIISNPNCSTIQMVVALKPLLDQFGLDQVHVSTYQSVSGTGQKGMKELADQVESSFKFIDPKVNVYAQPIAFNLLPAIDVLDSAGHCFEEEKLIRETRKILGLPQLDIFATTVRVPVYHCHGESIAVKLTKKVTRRSAIESFSAFPGIVLHLEDDHSQFPTPRQIAGSKDVHISRIRTPLDAIESNWLQFWVVADNLKKGAATNAVQILEAIS